VSDTVAATLSPAQATELARETHARQAQWAACPTAGVSPATAFRSAEALSPGTSISPGSADVDVTSPVLPAWSARPAHTSPAAAAPLPRTFTVTPPGSHAAFTFSTTGASAGSAASAASLRLVGVDFGAVLLPKFSLQRPTGPSLYASLVSHPAGVALLHAAGHVPALLTVALGLPLPPRPPPSVEPAAAAAVAPPATPLDRKAAWWALADVASTPAGLGLILAACPDWMSHVHALAHGLRLAKVVQWHGASHGGTLAVAAGVDEVDDVSCRWLGSAVMARMLRHARCTVPSPPASPTGLPPPVIGDDIVEGLGWQAGGVAQSNVTAASGSLLGGLTACTSVAAPLAAVPRSDIGAGAVLALHSPVADVPLLDDTQLPTAFLSASALPPAAPAWTRVLTRVMELSSRITQRDARAALLTLRNDDPDLFASTGLYAHVHALLSRYAVPLPVRRFVHGLFERVSFSDRAWEGMGAGTGVGGRE
jgi:hypothetical protein